MARKASPTLPRILPRGSKGAAPVRLQAAIRERPAPVPLPLGDKIGLGPDLPSLAQTTASALGTAGPGGYTPLGPGNPFLPTLAGNEDRLVIQVKNPTQGWMTIDTIPTSHLRHLEDSLDTGYSHLPIRILTPEGSWYRPPTPAHSFGVPIRLSDFSRVS